MRRVVRLAILAESTRCNLGTFARGDLAQSPTTRIPPAIGPIALSDWDVIDAMRLFVAHFTLNYWAFLEGCVCVCVWGGDTPAYKILPRMSGDSAPAGVSLR